MIDILTMIDDTPPERQSKIGTVLYSTSGFLVCDPKDFTRNQRLAYIELNFAQMGPKAESEKFVIECRLGLSAKAYQKAKAYGLYKFDNMEA